MTDWAGVLVLVCGVVAGGGFGYSVGTTRTTGCIQNEAIENGAAEWQIDAVTGVREFVWIRAKPRC